MARRELRRLQDEGFFKGRGYTDDSLTAALSAGKFRKCLQIQMLRSATGPHQHKKPCMLLKWLRIATGMTWAGPKQCSPVGVNQ